MASFFCPLVCVAADFKKGKEKVLAKMKMKGKKERKKKRNKFRS